VRIGAGSGIGVFRGQHHALPVVLHKITEERFTGPVCVDVSRVDEIAAGLTKSVVDPSRLVFGGAPTPIIAESHRAKRCLRNSKSAVAQKAVSHVNLLFCYVW